MSGSIPPGQPYVTDIHPTNINDVVYSVSGNPVLPSDVEPLGGGKYRVTFSASQVRCPGPIVITEGSTTIETTSVGPC